MNELTPEHINDSIARALKGESWLDPEVLEINGFSTATMRRLFSNLCHVEGLGYLEAGTFTGGTLFAAFSNNNIRAVGIDNFSQDFSRGNIREQFMSNLARFGGLNLAFLEGDCFALADNGSLEGECFDVFMYDGFHGYAEQAKALPAFLEYLADRFLLIVDDWNWPDVSHGTREGFKQLEGMVKIEQEWELIGNRRQDDLIYHNGLALFLCEKIK